MAEFDTLTYLRTVLLDTHSGIELPAAVIVETVQAEGGVVVAPNDWLRELAVICADHKILLIVDEIQTGCGRTGPFFSFEHAGIVPDIITVSKSISGYGLPMSLVLLAPELDLWEPGEHTGTFRGNQLAFVAATTALRLFEEEDLESRTSANAKWVSDRLCELCRLDRRLEARGVGMIWGLDTGALDPTGGLAAAISTTCFANGLVVERVGRNDTVLKVLPPLTIDLETLDAGLSILSDAVRSCLTR
jgi:diaminobutyrate-2-oxoglutarate transaminase